MHGLVRSTRRGFMTRQYLFPSSSPILFHLFARLLLRFLLGFSSVLGGGQQATKLNRFIPVILLVFLLLTSRLPGADLPAHLHAHPLSPTIHTRTRIFGQPLVPFWEPLAS